MNAIQKARNIANQILELNELTKEPHDIAAALKDDLEKYLSLLDSCNQHQILESLEIINSTEIPVFIELGIEDQLKEKLPIDYLVSYYSTRPDQIEFNSKIIRKHDLAKTIEQLRMLADSLHCNLLFNASSDTLTFSGDEKAKSIDTGELL